MTYPGPIGLGPAGLAPVLNEYGHRSHRAVRPDLPGRLDDVVSHLSDLFTHEDAMPALLATLIALVLITPVEAAKRPLRPVCTVGTLTQVEGTWMCLVPPKWVR